MRNGEHSKRVSLVDSRTADLINSGEVISNLGLAVKELVENSLDAKATRITVELHNYGVDCIEVSDNGCGISELDFECIARRHCTSKIENFVDLSNLTSFGFRGEALSSLCSLSEMTVITKHETSNVATKLVFTSEGKVGTKCTAARQTGTTVILRNLFNEYPVRRKQLIETKKKEFQKMIQLLTPYCVAFTSIQIHCRNVIRDKHVDILCVNANDSLHDNIIQLFGHNQSETIQEFVKHEISPEMLEEFDIQQNLRNRQTLIAITGLISKCDFGCSRSIPDRQFYLINNRPVELKRLKKIVNEVYGSFLKNQYPFVLLKIEVPKNSVDVNISPDKRTLVLDDEQLILAIIKSSLLNMYNNRSSIFQSSTQRNSSFQTAAEMLTAAREEPNNATYNISINRKRCMSPVDPEFDVTSADDTLELDTPSSSSPSSSNAFASDTCPQLFPVLKPTAGNNGKASAIKKKKTHQAEFTSLLSQQPLITDLFVPSIRSSVIEVESDDISVVHQINVVDNEKVVEAVKESAPVEAIDAGLDELVGEDEPDVSIVDEVCENIIRRVIHVKVNVKEIRNNFLSCSRNSNDVNKFSAKLSPEDNHKAENELKTELHKDSFKEMQIIGQFNKGFVVAKYKNDVFIVDQHASDEKYNFEDLCASTVLESQPLIHPVDLNLGSFHESVLTNNMSSFAKSGFKFVCDHESAPGKRVKLTAVPMSKDWMFGKVDIEEMLHEITDSGTISANYRPSRVKQMLASRACRKSIMIGDKLSVLQMNKLLKNMSLLCNPWTCAHGRPSIRHLFNEKNVFIV